MTNGIELDRRRFLGRIAMTVGAAHIGVFGTAEPNAASRELAAIGRASQWLNSPRLTPEHLAGKVVLVQFWTYTCINWLRTLPYVRAWAEKYKPLVVIGVHTPEFTFEHEIENVHHSAAQMGIEYPIAVDNEQAIWRAFDNQYWPALYLIDSKGRVRHHHFGEGGYEQSEVEIQRLLTEAGTAFSDPATVRVRSIGVETPAAWEDLKSPENYLGYQRTQNFASPGGLRSDRRHHYAPPSRFSLNQWALVGEWTMSREAIASSTPAARIVSRFHARDLHLVMGPARGGTPVRFRVTIDGRPPGQAYGVDIDENGNGTVLGQRLYQLIRQPKPIADRQFEIEFIDGGVEAYAFTFG